MKGLSVRSWYRARESSGGCLEGLVVTGTGSQRVKVVSSMVRTSSQEVLR